MILFQETVLCANVNLKMVDGWDRLNHFSGNFLGDLGEKWTFDESGALFLAHIRKT